MIPLLLVLLLQGSHPCDVVYPTVFRYMRLQLPNLKVGFCFEMIDTEGIPIIEPVGFSLQINDGSEIDLGIVQPLVGPNLQGLQYYEIQNPALAAGVITLKSYTAQLGMSGKSDAVTLTLLGTPRKPVQISISR